MDAEGFQGKYDFIYLPTDFRSWLAFGYAFVNMASNEDAVAIMEHLEGFNDWETESTKVCNVVWSDPYQGLEQNIERYRNSPVMNTTVDEQYKPLLLVDGFPVPFPEPTRKLRLPRVRRSSQYSEVRASMLKELGVNGELQALNTKVQQNEF